MGLVDDLDNISGFTKKSGMGCSVCKLLRQLPDDESKALDAALKNKDILGSALSRALANNGHKVSGGTLNRHRAGLCASGK